MYGRAAMQTRSMRERIRRRGNRNRICFFAKRRVKLYKRNCSRCTRTYVYKSELRVFQAQYIEKTSHCLQETCVLLQSPWCNNNPFILQHGRSKAATHARHRVSRRRVVLAEKGQKGSNTSILISARNKCVALVVRTTCYYVA